MFEKIRFALVFNFMFLLTARLLSLKSCLINYILRATYEKISVYSVN